MAPITPVVGVAPETTMPKKTAKKTAKKRTRSPRPGVFVIVRATGAGVHCGYLVSQDGDQVQLLEARRIWRWRGANTLHEVALRGASMTEFTRISEPVATITIIGAHEVILCTKEARKNLEVSRWL